jgi:hypothetical protein
MPELRFLAGSIQIIVITVINERHIVSYDYRIRTKIKYGILIQRTLIRRNRLLNVFCSIY